MSTLSFIHWNISPEIFSIGPVHIRWYGLLFALAFILGYQILFYIFKIENKSQKQLDSLTIYMVIGTIFGARLGHCLFYEPNIYLANPIEILYVWHGGLASHGAAIGILLSLWLYLRKNREFNFLWMVDRLVIVVALAAFFVRLGNFFNSEILGLPSTVPWAVVFERIDKFPRHPAQLYEGITYLLLFIVLLSIYIKNKVNLRLGLTTGIFLTSMFTMRFLIEYVKEYQAEFESTLPLDMGQFLSIPFIILGIIFLFVSLKRNKKIET
ncbi:MAG: lgt [Ignavibacteria bacterium]|nr:lgt [Ignavibacteria bacterium]